MSYFSKFPLLKYPVKDGQTTRYVFVRNLLRRVAMSEDLKSGESVFLEYDIKDGERPEHIAERVYGDPTYHWLILLCNDIIDPYHGWYKSGGALEDYIQNKHAGYSVYITNSTNGFFYASELGTGATLTQGNSITSVIDYTPELCKLAVLGTGFSEGSANIGVSGGDNYSVYIHRVDPSWQAANHFRISYSSGLSGADTAFTVDPLSQQTGSYSIVGGVIGSVENEYPTLPTDGVTYSPSGTVDFWETYIGRYMGVSGDTVNTYVVTNYTYENEQNDSKRTIKVLHPRFKRTALSELESLLRV